MKFSNLVLAAVAAKTTFAMAKGNQSSSSTTMLRSPSTIDDRVLHPDSWYHEHNYNDHAQCTRPKPLCGTCDYKRDEDYYQSMVENSQVEDGHQYTPPDNTVTCGDVFTGFVKLTSNLVCDRGARTADGDPYDGRSVQAITLDGPGSLLDCDGNTIMMPVATFQGGEEESAGIVLKNGAKAINCNVVGFATGVLMENGNNVLKNSMVGGSQNNIRTMGSNSCMVLDGVESTGAISGSGLQVQHEGTMLIFDSTFTGNAGDGVFSGSAEIGSDLDLCFSADNADASGNVEFGFNLRHGKTTDIKRSRANFNGADGLIVGAITLEEAENPKLNLEDVQTIGNALSGISTNSFDVSTFGSVTSLGNQRGYVFTCFHPCDLNVKGDLELEGAEQVGILFGGEEDISVSVEDCAFLKACSNINGDIRDDVDSSATVTFEGGGVTCGTENVDGLDCKSCPNDVGEGTICTSPVAAYCYPKPEW
mmetsp:Transcript_28703/g.53916  ORF Transcript_28703/g.53916 Transcript_28703/m.53916 type:complete len:477 (+) Transcript_28703:223-1653(+)